MRKNIFLILIILTMGLASQLYATTYTVKQDSTGDFTTIQAAIDFVHDDDEIIVYEGTYNEQIYLLGKNILLASRYHISHDEQYIEETVISYQSNPFLGVINLVDNEMYPTIEGFTIQDGYIGINMLRCESPTIQNCIVRDNTYGIRVRKGTGSLYDPQPFIFKNDISYNSIIGIHCYEQTRPDISYNLIKENVCGISAFGVPFRETYPSITHNTLDGNTNDAIYFEYAISEVNNNLIINSNYVFGLVGPNHIEVNNCTINNGYQLMTGGLDYISISNSIIRNLTQLIPSEIQISYSNIESSILVNGNINEDPMFADTTNNDYHLRWDNNAFSPCIDAGDPSLSDPDGSPSDMGCYPAMAHDYYTVSLPSPLVDDGWKWLSLPVLDTLWSEGDIAGTVLADILDPAILDTVFAKNYIIYHIYPNWYNDDRQFFSTAGYKFHMNEAAELAVSGFQAPDSTSIYLEGDEEENWIGYFIDQTQTVVEAFEDYWDGDNIFSIKHQKWTVKKIGGEWVFPGGRIPSLRYGDMVIVQCKDDISNFRWANSTSAEEEFEYQESQYFVYEEQADYVPIFLDLDVAELPLEIGALVNGVCIGATVVEDTLAQIRAYTTSAPPGDIEFELVYELRGETRTCANYGYFGFSGTEAAAGRISTGTHEEAWFVTLRDDGKVVPQPERLTVTNYPNPFNPSTRISYSLPADLNMDLSVYNVRGQKVRTLVAGYHAAGSYSVIWDGRDGENRSVGSGIYFYQLTSGDKTLIKKMLMIK